MPLWRKAENFRKAGIKKPCLILCYTYEEDYDRIVKEDFQPTVFKLSMAEQLSKAAVKANKTLKIHIKLDTGMTRIGYRHILDAVPEIVEISKLPNIELEGIFTHFARADETDLARHINSWKISGIFRRLKETWNFHTYQALL